MGPDIETLKKMLPCEGDRRQLDDHERRIRTLEAINEKLSLLVLGEGESILKRLDRIEQKLVDISEYLMKHENDIESLRDIKQTVGIQRFFGSGLFKVFLGITSAGAGAVVTYLLMHFL